MRSVILVALAFVASVALAGQIYTWKDASGQVHYSDTPPSGAAAKSVRTFTPTYSGEGGNPTAERRSLANQEAAFREQQKRQADAQAKADKAKALAKRRAQACDQARRMLAALKSGQRMTRFTESGERVFLTDKERAAATTKSQKEVQQYCSN